MTLDEINQEIKAVDSEIDLLRQKHRVLRIRQIILATEEAVKNIGRCFISNGAYVKVIGIPKERQVADRVVFNEYEYPSIYLTRDNDDDPVPIYYDTLNMKRYTLFGDDDSLKEISCEEFDVEFNRRMMEFCTRAHIGSGSPR